MSLTLSSDYMTATDFLIYSAPSNLKRFDIDSAKVETTSVHDLLAAIKENCPQIELLHLKSADGSNYSGSIDAVGHTLLNLKYMKSFVTRHPFETFNLEDSICIWTSLEELYLDYRSSSSTNQDDTGFAPDCLRLLARHCPSLHALTLQIDWTYITPEFGLNTKDKLRNLTFFDGGVIDQTLPPDKIAGIAIFLVNLAVPTAAILAEPYLDGVRPYSAEELQPWKEVKSSMVVAVYYDMHVHDLLHRQDQERREE